MAPMILISAFAHSSLPNKHIDKEEPLGYTYRHEN